MKRLLALLLCLMLFVSVIPTSAFAAVDLSPAYEARENLYTAYSVLGAAQLTKNAIIGIDEMMGDKLPQNRHDGWISRFEKLLVKIGEVVPGTAKTKVIQKIFGENVTFDFSHAYSYYGLAKEITPRIVQVYKEVGTAVVKECVTSEDTLKNEVVAEYLAESNAVTAAAQAQISSLISAIPLQINAG